MDEQLRHPTDQPTIGILLCKSKNDVVVEYALRDVSKPIAVPTWQTRLVESLPEELEEPLPSVEEMEVELAGQGRTPPQIAPYWYGGRGLQPDQAVA